MGQLFFGGVGAGDIVRVGGRVTHGSEIRAHKREMDGLHASLFIFLISCLNVGRPVGDSGDSEPVKLSSPVGAGGWRYIGDMYAILKGLDESFLMVGARNVCYHYSAPQSPLNCL